MKVLVGLGLCFFPLFLHAQEKCAHVAYQKQLQEKSLIYETEPEFEKWMQQKTLKAPTKPSSANMNRTASINGEAKFVIPIVVHVVHHGETIGTGANIPDEQIFSQIKILNDDFRAKNTAAIDKLPAEFKSLAADAEIEFILAKQDPEGLPTNGIVRIASSEANWSQDEDITLKSLSHWPSSKYLNLYVAELSSSVLGWAQFPQSSQLSGLNFSDIAEETDGVVVSYRHLGIGHRAVASSKGRTATHEIGHYFGLRHIWGDGNCSKDDFVADTPATDDSHSGCPTNSPKSACTGGLAMFQNYMDYTDDGCMVLFTHGQKERLHVVLTNSPRRKDLHNSPAKQEPTTVANDAGLKQFLLTSTQSCNGGYTPSLEIRNYGNTKVTQVKVELKVDQTLIKTYTFNTSLDYLQSVNLQLDDLQITDAGIRVVSATIIQTNATTDNKASNNSVTAEVVVPFKTNLPVVQQFENGLAPFTLLNPDFGYTWQLADVPDGKTTNNTAALMNFYDYESIGQKDILASPILDLFLEKSAYLSFNVAHARYHQESSNDGLAVYVTTDCKNSLETAELIFQASGDKLATANATGAPFAPADANDWRTIELDLSAYVGLETVQVLFVGINDYGNNIYLDEIRISNTISAPLNIALSGLLQPSPVFGASSSPVTVELKNVGIVQINSVHLKVSLGGTVLQDVVLDNLDLASQEAKLVSLGDLPQLEEGLHEIEVLAYLPNEQPDGSSIDNLLKRQFVRNKAENDLPLRESFGITTFDNNRWTSVAPQPGNPGWETVEVVGPYNGSFNSNYASVAQSAGNPRLREKWLASPGLNMQHATAAGMQFWYYAGGNGNASLQVLASLDNGLTWPILLWQKENTELKPESRVAPDEPEVSSNWHKDFISLKELVGEPGARIAFVAKSQHAAAVYVDEIEFFLSDQPIHSPLPERNNVALFPNPTRGEVNLIFNMENPEGEDVIVELFHANGLFISRNSFPNTLNQIYTLQAPDLPAGIYYLRIRSTSLNTSRKFVLVR